MSKLTSDRELTGGSEIRELNQLAIAPDLPSFGYHFEPQQERPAKSTQSS